jgi:hypothetical protein
VREVFQEAYGIRDWLAYVLVGEVDFCDDTVGASDAFPAAGVSRSGVPGGKS